MITKTDIAAFAQDAREIAEKNRPLAALFTDMAETVLRATVRAKYALEVTGDSGHLQDALKDLGHIAGRAEAIAAILRPPAVAYRMGPSISATLATVEPDWQPLLDVLTKYNRCVRVDEFMHMGTVERQTAMVSASPLAVIQTYKHRNTRRYINIDSTGQCYTYAAQVPDGPKNYQPITADAAVSYVFS